jgi:DNA-binding MarR family transcriptional regulator
MEVGVRLTGQAFGVLIRLYRSPGESLRMSDLAAQTGLSRSGLTRALDRLVEVGLCERASCDGDRRGTFAVLTECGHNLMDDALVRHEHHIRTILTGVLSSQEETELTRLLERVRNRVHPDAALLSEEASTQLS